MSTLSFIHHPSTNTGINVIITQETSKMLPWWAVSTEDHMMHHRVQASDERCDFFLNHESVVSVPEDTSLNPPNLLQVKHFSAPTISVDRILERTMSLTKGKSSVVKPAAATAAG